MTSPSPIPPVPSTRETLSRIADLCARFGVTSLDSQIRAAVQTLDGGLVDVAVLGQFKAGKSSFLNTLFGRTLMPVDVLPATAVITRVGYGEAERAEVQFLSGDRRAVSPDAIAPFITEADNPDNAKGVAMVEVTVPALAPFAGVRFVDTPGLGSLFRHNTLTSMDWLPRVGAAVVAISIDRPVSEQDAELLDELSRHTPEVLVLLTKADMLTAPEAARVVEFTRGQLRERLGRAIPVFPFSIRPGYEAERRVLSDFLIERVVRDSAARFEDITTHKLRVIAVAAREYLEVARHAANANEAARAELGDALSAERESLDESRRQIEQIANRFKNDSRDDVLSRFAALSEPVSTRMRADMARRAEGWPVKFSQITEAYSTWLEAVLAAEITAAAPEGEAFCAPWMDGASAAIARQVRAFQDRLARAIEAALATHLSGAPFEARLSPPPPPRLKADPPFDIPFDLLWFLFPMRYVRPRLIRYLDGRVAWELKKNLSRLAMQWATATADAIDALAAGATAFIENELIVVDRMVRETPTRRAELDAAINEIDGVVDGLEP